LVTLRKLELHFFASKQVVSFATEWGVTYLRNAHIVHQRHLFTHYFSSLLYPKHLFSLVRIFNNSIFTTSANLAHAGIKSKGYTERAGFLFFSGGPALTFYPATRFWLLKR
jgi:hypothetical protein